jgi:DNA-binding PadR family transcriptional regulator
LKDKEKLNMTLLERYETLEEAIPRCTQLWENTELFKSISFEKFRLMNENELRKQIIKIFRDGVPIEGSNKRRHVLSAIEVLNIINKKITEFNEKMSQKDEGTNGTLYKTHLKKTMFYYHINELENAGYIEKVIEIKEKKKWVTYYNRTAKLFLADFAEDEEHLNIINNLHRLIKIMNPEVSQADLDDLEKETIEIKKELSQMYKSWIVENQKLIDDFDVKIQEIFSFFKMIEYSHPRLQEIANFHLEKLNFNLL